MSSMSVADQLYVALLSIWVIVSVASNMSVIACIWRTAKDRKTVGRRSLNSTDILLVSLAVNDIILAGVVLPQKIHDISHSEHFFECKYLEILALVYTASISLMHVLHIQISLLSCYNIEAKLVRTAAV